MAVEIAYLSATSLRGAYSRAELSAVEVVRTLADRIDQRDGQLNAVAARNLDHTLREARDSAIRWRQRRARPLEGIPILVKDLIDTKELRTTYGSGMFADHIPVRDADVVALLRRAGAIVLGKSATHEFGWGITTESEWFGATVNPWASGFVPGGSSGGSAVGLAAGYAPLALGTDTAGSIRIPAAFCGVCGLKPTFGAVSLAGVHALAPSLDHVGPMARTVADLDLLYSVIASQTSKPAQRPAPGMLSVGVCPDLDQVPLGSGAAKAVEFARLALREAGVRVVTLRAPVLPSIYSTLATTLIVEAHRTHTGLGLWPARSHEYSTAVRARLELAQTIGLAEYLHAQHSRTVLRAELSRMLTRVDALLSPVSAVGPIPIGQQDIHDRIGQRTYREQVLTSTAPQSLSGLPSLTVRAGFHNGLPIGVQLTAAAWQEPVLFVLGDVLQAHTPEVQRRWPAQAADTSTANQLTEHC
jgi:aspartyl-tRNA(Asn)/glutamyl-tRNA(Gln) amidotransferase subunit A